MTAAEATAAPRWPECTIPPISTARGYEADATAELFPRYEDVTQDGRVQLPSLMPGLGAVWRALGGSERLATLRQQGILPILRRIVIIGEPGPFSAQVPIETWGTWRLAREQGGERLFLNMWLEARAPIGSTLAPPPGPDAEKVRVGRIFAEHVITRPFAPPAERKVTRLDVPGLPALPEDDHPFLDAADLVAGHTLEPARHVAFGMLHTDSNQHVNSLVYPRLFEEAAIEHATKRATAPDPHTLLAVALELRYRKPFFAGDRATLSLRTASVAHPPHRAAAVGAFASHDTPEKPSCTVAAWLR